MSKRVLIVDDEKAIVDILEFNLQRDGYETLKAYDGPEGLRMAREENPDLLLLDIMLPGMDGFEVCRTLRGEGNDVPIVMITAREEETDKVFGLEIGADDYVTKPFSMRELLARVKANMRRTVSAAPAAEPENSDVIRMRDIIIDPDRHAVIKAKLLLDERKKSHGKENPDR